MGYRRGSADIIVHPQDLQDFAWTAPMRDLAAKVGLSDVGLKKLLRASGIVAPPQGYWNKLHAGKHVPKSPKVAARRPGETGRVRLDARFIGVLNAVEPFSSLGPFASASVPEDLALLYEQELDAIGRVAVPRNLERFHHGLSQIFKKEDRRREKFAASGWSWDAPQFGSAVDRRRLTILNAVFMALSKRGHSARAYERDGEIHATATIGDSNVGLSIEIAGKHRSVREYGRDRPAPDLPASTPLAFVIGADRDDNLRARWEDNKTATLETQLRQIVASIVVAGEVNFRRGLRRAEEWAEQCRRWEEQRRQERIEARNGERLKHLHESGTLLRRAEELRALISRVREALSVPSVGVDPAAIEEWEKWASAEADRLDPVLSGQIMSHLEPAEDDR